MATLVSVELKDEAAFERNFIQLKPFYYGTRYWFLYFIILFNCVSILCGLRGEDSLELATLFSVELKDEAAFERHFIQLKPFYYGTVFYML